MITPEVNDVDISRLFNYRKESKINFGEKEVKVFIRLVGDSDLNIARVKALRASNDLRKRLKDKNSDEYIAFIGGEELFEKETLISLIVLHASKDISREAVNKVDVPFPKEPDEDSTIEEQENYQQAVDSYLEQLQSKIDEFVQNRVKNLKEDLESKSKEELFQIYEKYQIDALCENEMVKVFREYCTFSGIYADKKYSKRFFQSFEEFQNLPSAVKERFIAEYESLDIPSEELKK